MLLGLVMDFCEAVNQEDAPKVESSVNRLILEETRVIQDDAYFELKSILDEEIGMEPVTEAQMNETTRRALQQTVRSLQYNLSRLLAFDEILQETTKFRQRAGNLIQSVKTLGYVQGFYFSRQLLMHLVASKQDKLTIARNQDDDLNDICDEPESIEQHQNVNRLFNQWQKLIKVYRSGGGSAPGGDDLGDDMDESQDQIENDELVVTMAHFDVLAECMTKLIAQRPEWIGKDI